MPDDPDRQHLADHHNGDPGYPTAPVQQVNDQAKAQEMGLRLLLSRVLLQHKAGADQHRADDGDRDGHVLISSIAHRPGAGLAAARAANRLYRPAPLCACIMSVDLPRVKTAPAIASTGYTISVSSPPAHACSPNACPLHDRII